MKYKPSRTFELTLKSDIQSPGNLIEPKQNQDNLKLKVDKLRELKQLLDEKLITPEDYEKEKKKILDEK